MSFSKLLLTTAKDRSYGELIVSACQAVQPTHIYAALAYATNSGVGELMEALRGVPAWKAASKQWLIGIDFCRSDPKALTDLDSLAKSSVRIHDGAFVSRRRGCTPRVSFHPKLYIFANGGSSGAVVGSGNLSQTGLRIGVEAGAYLHSSTSSSTNDTLDAFKMHWQKAIPWQSIAQAYETRYFAQDNLRQPTPTDDDSAPQSAGAHGQLTPDQLRQLRASDHLWISAGNLHANRGHGRPGNQLMLKRNSRVFFGFYADDLAVNTTIGAVAVKYGSRERKDCSLRFSDNSMDVLRSCQITV